MANTKTDEEGKLQIRTYVIKREFIVMRGAKNYRQVPKNQLSLVRVLSLSPKVREKRKNGVRRVATYCICFFWQEVIEN